MRLLGFVYKCGCPAEEVGQTFKDGVLVCPLHEESMAPYDHPEQPWTGRASLTLELRAPTRETAQRWLDDLTETLLREEIVRGVVSTS